MKRANFSANFPNWSWSMVGRRISCRLVSFGWSRREALSRLRSAIAAALLAPVVRQEVVQQVVDGDSADESVVVVDDGCGHQVVRREVAGALLERGGRLQGLQVV